MLVLGLNVATRNNKRIIRGVLLDVSDHSVVEVIDHVPNPGHNEAMQAREARDSLVSALRAHEVAATVLLEADYHRQAKVTKGAKMRLRLEGACLAACRETVTLVEVMNGPALGKACGGKKEDALGAASELDVEEKLVEAAAAALAAKSLLSDA